jgi:hypothetical protein
MKELWNVFAYLRDNPATTSVMVGILVAGYYFFSRRSRAFRDADRRFEELRDRRSNYYNGLRPPQ